MFCYCWQFLKVVSFSREACALIPEYLIGVDFNFGTNFAKSNSFAYFCCNKKLIALKRRRSIIKFVVNNWITLVNVTIKIVDSCGTISDFKYTFSHEKFRCDGSFPVSIFVCHEPPSIQAYINRSSLSFVLFIKDSKLKCINGVFVSILKKEDEQISWAEHTFKWPQSYSLR